MTAFDQAWELLKEFYFDPERAQFNEKYHDDGKIKQFSSALGTFHGPALDPNRLRVANDGQGMEPHNFRTVPSLVPVEEQPGSPWVEGKHQPVMLPRNVLMEHHGRNTFAPMGVDRRTMQFLGGENGLPHYAGVNLSSFQGEEDLESIVTSLIHEHGHAAIDNELMTVLWDKMIDAQSQEDAQDAYMQYAGQHEYGAYNLQNPGGEDAQRAARFGLITHPNWHGGTKFPKAHINTGDEV